MRLNPEVFVDGDLERVTIPASLAKPTPEQVRRESAASLAELVAELEERAALGFPPSGDLVVVEVRHGPMWTDQRMRDALGGLATLLGPVDTPRGRRWLLQGADLGATRSALRGVVQELRDGGGTVRVDSDPLDL